jgi:hypothetical protein
MRRPWFGRRHIGFGVGPRTWQGWLVTAIYIGLALGIGRNEQLFSDWTLYLEGALLVAFVAVVVATSRN